MLLIENGNKQCSFKVVSLIKGRFSDHKVFKDDLFVTLQITTDLFEEDYSDALKWLFENSKQYSKQVLVPEKYVNIIKDYWETGDDLFISFELEKSINRLYKIKSLIVLNKID